MNILVTGSTGFIGSALVSRLAEGGHRVMRLRREPRGGDAGPTWNPETCRAWEAAADPARLSGVRVVTLRLGIVVARHGGALAKMLPVFRLGLGGRLGSGGQYWSWIALDDLVRVVELALLDDRMNGPARSGLGGDRTVEPWPERWLTVPP